MEIIETRILLGEDSSIQDHQSRIIDVNNWQEYQDLFRQYNGKKCGDFNGTMPGYVLKDNVVIETCECNNFNKLVAYIKESNMWGPNYYILIAYGLDE